MKGIGFGPLASRAAAVSALALLASCRPAAVSPGAPSDAASPPHRERAELPSIPPAPPSASSAAIDPPPPLAPQPAVSSPPSPAALPAAPPPSWEEFRQCAERGGRWAVRPAAEWRGESLAAVARKLGLMRGRSAEDSLCHDDARQKPGCAQTACAPDAQLTWRFDARKDTVFGHVVLRLAQGAAAYPVETATPFGSAGPCFCMGSEFAEVKWVDPQQLDVAYFVQGGGGKMCSDIDVSSTWLLEANGEPILVIDSTAGAELNATVGRVDDIVTIKRGSFCSAQVSWTEVVGMKPERSRW